MGPSDLIRVQLELECIGVDGNGWLFRISGDNPDDMHRVFLVRHADGTELFIRHDVDTEAVVALRRHPAEHWWREPAEVRRILYESPERIERFPRLRVGFLESGIGWVPYWFERMDEHYAKLARLVPELKRPPSDWAKDPRVIFSCDPDEEALPMALELLGDTQMMYASDYPHWDAMTPWTVKIIAERGDLTEDAKRKILGENAARFYGIP